MKKIKWVHQEDERGCAVACLAMVTGKPYGTVKREILSDYHSGIEDEALDRYLAENGCYIARHTRTPLAEIYNEWPIAPFTDIHIVAVIPSLEIEAAHVVVMDGKGRVYDPLSQEPKQLNDYPRVLWIAGIIKPSKRKQCRSSNTNVPSATTDSSESKS